MPPKHWQHCPSRRMTDAVRKLLYCRMKKEKQYHKTTNQ